MPPQVGPDISGLGNQQVYPEQQQPPPQLLPQLPLQPQPQHQQQRQGTPEQWRVLRQEQQQDASGAPQPSFSQV